MVRRLVTSEAVEHAREAPREPEPAPADLSPAAVRALQRSAGNQATAALLARGRPALTRPLLQARWLVHESPNYCFWEDEAGKPVPSDQQIPVHLHRIRRYVGGEIPEPPYRVDDGDGEPTLVPGRDGAVTVERPQRADQYAKTYGDSNSSRRGGRRDPPLFYEADWYAERARQGGATRLPGDMFNPFGRFANAAETAFFPSPQLPADIKRAVLERLALKDRSFRRITAPDPNQPPPLMSPQDTDRLYYLQYPRQVQVDGGSVLPLADVTERGAIYATGAPGPGAHDIARPVDAPKDPAKLGLVPLPAEFKFEQNFVITPQLIANWQGQDREKQQGAVMGASAAEAAENAGFPVANKRDWEWLHMIAHSLGGIGGTSPQVPENLVAGTRECNSEMIVAEEMLKMVIAKTGPGGAAKLVVAVRMFDAVRHIGSEIHYSFLLHNSAGEASMVEHFSFNPLDKTQPQQFKNRAIRYVAMLMHPEGKGAPKGSATDYEPLSGATAHRGDNPLVAPASEVEIDRLIGLAATGQFGHLADQILLAWNSGGTVSKYVFEAIGERIRNPQSLLDYLRAFRAAAGTGHAARVERAVYEIVRSSLLDRAISRENLQALVTQFYGPATPPPKLVELLKPLTS